VSAPPGTQTVRYLLNGVEVARADAAPFEAWWGLEIGEYQLTAVAVSADGSEQTSAPVPFSVVEYEDPVSRNAP
jgi:hypothetical protein